jgi:uracil-DNA glycosylase
MKHSEAYLREMGLWPVWRGKRAFASDEAGVVEVPEAAVTAESQSTRTGAAASAIAFTGLRLEAKAGAQQSTRRDEILALDWVALKACVRDCTACALHAQRKQAVFGVGDENAEWLFVGEGPGAEEDQRGEPFVGQAGKLLDNMLAAIDLKRGRNVYIANVVKCRPPGNRNPEPNEAQACEPFLARQIELIRPKLIVALGKVAAQNLLQSDASIASLRGRLHSYHGIPMIVTYHPAYLLRALPDKAKAWMDLLYARKTMASLTAGG